jgi:hypothetical protein
LDVCVVDYYDDSPCKKYAERSFLESVADTDKVASLIKENHIDGALCGYTETLLPFYVDICQKANVPCYTNVEQIAVSTNKAKFKEKCREFGVPVLEEYSFDDVTKGKAQFPIVVKPVDSAAAKGVYICTNLNEFEEAYSKALSFSPSKHILIERCACGTEATMFYYFDKGEAYLTAMGDRHLFKFSNKHIPLPVGYTFPSSSLENAILNVDPFLKALFKNMKMNAGMAFVQVFVEGDKISICEIGYRLTPSFETFIIDYYNHFNVIEQMINFAVGNDVDGVSLRRVDPHKGPSANITLLLKEGEVSNFEGLDDVSKMDGVIKVLSAVEVGHKINSNAIGTLAQVGVRVLLTADSQEQLIYRMDQIKDKIHVYDQNGNDMVIRNYTYKTLCKG